MTAISETELAKLRRALSKRLREQVRECQSLKYNPTAWIEMLTDMEPDEAIISVVGTNPNTTTSGFTRLFLEKRLDLTVEAEIVENQRWAPLFSEDCISVARERLDRHGYYE